MTTEAILILFLSVLIILGVYFGDNGPINTFKDAGPRLGVKIERSISIGSSFMEQTENRSWRSE